MFKLLPIILFMFAALVVLSNQSAVNGATLKCEYHKSITMVKDVDVYYCDVNDNGIFTDERVKIDAVEGRHKAGLGSKNVTGLELKCIPSFKFFPGNLENFFSDLIAIEISETNLEEIKQEDIKVFPKLQYINLGHNKITTIDANLFEFNPELTEVVLYDNQIDHIDRNAFDHLNNLRYLSLSENKCKNNLTYARNSRSEVLELVQEVKNGGCSNDDDLAKEFGKALNETFSILNSAINGLKKSNSGCRLSFFNGHFLIFFIILFVVITNTLI